MWARRHEWMLFVWKNKDCTSHLCQFEACGYCLSNGSATHRGSVTCIETQKAQGCHGCGVRGCCSANAQCINIIRNTEDTRTSGTLRTRQQCFINASATALFASPMVRKHLYHVLQHMRSSADEALQQRFCSLSSLANRTADCKSDDVLEGTLDQRLAVTLHRAMLHSAEGQSFPPWLLWNSFYHVGQEEAQENLLKAVQQCPPQEQPLFKP